LPFATNALDGRSVYYEDDGGAGPPVVFLAGLSGPVPFFRTWGVSMALGPGYRRIYIDHRGHGCSDKPHEPEAYTTPLRVADVVAALDAIRLQKAHFIGASWGARLAFGIGDHARDRALSLTMGGQMPYAMDPEGPIVAAVTHALDLAPAEGMRPFTGALAAFGLDEDGARALEDNDAAAISAAWRGALMEGVAAQHMSDWDVPCLVYVGAEDADFFAGAKRAAEQIPGAHFVALDGLNHLQAHANVDQVLPHIKSMIDG
jgi:pimeloyl-ACP methyl ester carboxylesterase